MNDKQISNLFLTAIFFAFILVALPYCIDFFQDKKYIPAMQEDLREPSEANLTVLNKNAMDMVIHHLVIPKTNLQEPYHLTLNAQESKLANNSDLIFSTNLTCTIYKQNIPLVLVTAHEAFFNRTKNYLFFSDDFKGLFQEIKIEGNKVFYDLNQQTIHSDLPFSYRHPQFFISGAKNILNLKTKNMRLSNGVKSEFYKARQATSAVTDAGLKGNKT